MFYKAERLTYKKFCVIFTRFCVIIKRFFRNYTYFVKYRLELFWKFKKTLLKYQEYLEN